jgi:hypothetical protein
MRCKGHAGEVIRATLVRANRELGNRSGIPKKRPQRRPFIESAANKTARAGFAGTGFDVSDLRFVTDRGSMNDGWAIRPKFVAEVR